VPATDGAVVWESVDYVEVRDGPNKAMTKVLVLGGAGFQGSRAARMLAASEHVQELLVVDAQRDVGQREAAKLGPKASGGCVDATDKRAVASLLRDQAPDLMLNCSGPYRLTGLSSLDASIECGVDYVDLLDDKALMGSYWSRDERARAAGVTAICCTGWTPGLTNIMAAQLARDLDEVDQIHITWLGSVTLDVSPHLMVHRVELFGGDAAAVCDGALITIPGGGSRISVPWPGCGTFTAAICTHPEPVTLHRRFPGLRHATIRGSYTAPEFLDLVCSLGRSGMLERNPIDADGQRVAPEAFIGAFLTSPAFTASTIHAAVASAQAHVGDLDGARVVLVGRRGGAAVARAARYLSDQRWRSTYGVAAVCAELVARGEVRVPGVHTPEALDAGVVVPALDAGGFGFDEFPADDAPELLAVRD
jgi:saccharopine dehydrogenase-like NADP-dependent oxidoreductase